MLELLEVIMEYLKQFCEIVRKRSEENSKSIKLLYENKLYGNCISILRQELDSMVRVLFLLSQKQETRQVLIQQTLDNEKWHIERKQIRDIELINNVLHLYGWARNVYMFGCSFSHLSVFHYYSEQDPFEKLSTEELKVIKNFMVQYHNFPQYNQINFVTMKPYILDIFDKIRGNLQCSLRDLEKNPVDTFVI